MKGYKYMSAAIYYPVHFKM